MMQKIGLEIKEVTGAGTDGECLGASDVQTMLFNCLRSSTKKGGFINL